MIWESQAPLPPPPTRPLEAQSGSQEQCFEASTPVRQCSCLVYPPIGEVTHRGEQKRKRTGSHNLPIAQYLQQSHEAGSPCPGHAATKRWSCIWPWDYLTPRLPLELPTSLSHVWGGLTLNWITTTLTHLNGHWQGCHQYSWSLCLSLSTPPAPPPPPLARSLWKTEQGPHSCFKFLLKGLNTTLDTQRRLRNCDLTDNLCRAPF